MARSKEPEQVEPGNLDGKEEHRLEYIKGMLTLIEQDIRQVHLYITFALATSAFIATRLDDSAVGALPSWVRWMAFLGILLLVSAALCFFSYIRALHITRMKVTRCLASCNVVRTRELWAGDAGVWAEDGFKYRLGQASVGLASLCVGAFFFYTIVMFVPPLAP